jgi:hypothetical protein
MTHHQAFLDACLEYGIKRVAICVADKRIPRSLDFPFGPQSSAFTLESARFNGWPSVWQAAEVAGVYDGCGNTAQAQVKPDLLDHGYWQYSKRMGWRKLP